MTSFSKITDSFAYSLGGHQLVPGQGWMDEGGRGGLLWTTEQQSQYHRYQVGQVPFILFNNCNIMDTMPDIKIVKTNLVSDCTQSYHVNTVYLHSNGLSNRSFNVIIIYGEQCLKPFF
jgi:hypothetical protein